MYPLFFGSKRQLYGVYHMPDPALAKPLGVVLCQPVFHEQGAARRAVRALADRFAEAGIHALRFDYSGAGDSQGEPSDHSLEDWIDDVGGATDEFATSRGLDSVGLVGLRFGASLAARAAANRADVPFLVLWEPIVDGAPWVQSLRDLQNAWVAHETDQRPGARKAATPDEVCGHPLPPGLANQLSAHHLCRESPPGVDRVLIIEESECDQMGALVQKLDESGSRVERRNLDGGRVWHREFDAEQAQVPRDLLVQIVDWASEEIR